MSIRLIDEDFNKASSGKNDLPKSDLSTEEITNMIKKILSNVEDNKHRKKRHGIFHNIPPAPPLPRRLDDDFGKEIKRATRNLKNKVKYSIIESEPDTNSDTSESSTSSSS